MLRNELKDVHKRFKDETVVFKRRAQISRKNMQEVEAAPEYVADVVQNVERPKREQIAKMFRSAKSVFDTSEPSTSAQSDLAFGSTAKMESNLTLPSFSFLETEKPPRESVFKSFFVIYFLAYLPLAWSTRVS